MQIWIFGAHLGLFWTKQLSVSAMIASRTQTIQPQMTPCRKYPLSHRLDSLYGWYAVHIHSDLDTCGLPLLVRWKSYETSCQVLGILARIPYIYYLYRIIRNSIDNFCQILNNQPAKLITCTCQ